MTIGDENVIGKGELKTCNFFSKSRLLQCYVVSYGGTDECYHHSKQICQLLIIVQKLYFFRFSDPYHIYSKSKTLKSYVCCRRYTCFAWYIKIAFKHKMSTQFIESILSSV